MYLSNLEIFGFKSFAQKTVINFNEGVTSIVGPNGCGKTNIVDAIRWCLGEQRSSALRSDKMENVIFNGTATKKPMGMAEVSLTIENTKGILPIEYTDITITRRIFRSGESEYLLNKNICRLKDIVNLFMDTGIGANAYSVIELKMVETILSSKAEERRTMFEEAAGVNKYKLRRRLALRKLDEVKSDLTRVNDIVVEVSKTVASLERQAKKADKYNKISSTLRELELDLSERELALFEVQTRQILNGKEENSQKKISFESELNRLSDELKIYKLKLSEAEELLNSRRGQLKLHVEKVFSVKNVISVSTERKNSLEKNIESYKKELSDLNIQLHSTTSGIEKKILESAEMSKNIEQKIYSQKVSGSRVREFKKLVDEKRSEIKSQSDVIVEKMKAVTSAENDYSNLEKQLKEKNDSTSSLNSRILGLTNDVAKTVGFIESLKDEKQSASKRLAEAEENYTRSQNEKKNLESQLNKLRSNEVELKGLINGLHDKILFVRNLIETLEGFSKGTKELLKNRSWAKRDNILLVDAGTTNDKFKKAVEASLQHNLNNLIITSIEDLNTGIEFLQSNDLGRASFYLLDKKQKDDNSITAKMYRMLQNRRRKKIERSDGFVGWASGYIRSDIKWKPAFEKLLSYTAVMKDFETALKFSNSYTGFCFTTLDGDFFDRNGVVTSGSTLQVDESLFGRKQLLEKLNQELPLKQKQVAELAKEIEQVEQKLDKIDLNILSDE
ncbi:MAG TPA: AAA family ATPase, partial [Ignavibacteriaceae bacterium]